MSARRATSLTLDRTLLDDARALGVNISRAAESGLAEAVKTARDAQWRTENQKAISEYNAFIDENEIPLREFRKF